MDYFYDHLGKAYIKMKILLTGAAGFIGFHLAKKLVQLGHEVIGLDNLNGYYDPDLKYSRLKELGISAEAAKNYGTMAKSGKYGNIRFFRMDLEDREGLPALFKSEQPEIVCNLAAQAGVRYSLQNPETYVDSNIVGFLNLLECCRGFKVRHLVYASSSSVYGLNEDIPFKTTDFVDRPISLYAATKKSNELMAHTYSHLFGFRTTGLRFFTVYGPWGRPDMAMFLFTKSILENSPIQVFNHGEQERDFTFIDDIVEGIVPIVEGSHSPSYDAEELYHLYNIGNGRPVGLIDFIEAIEKVLDKTAIREMMPEQPGDVKRTWADTAPLERDYGYRPDTPIEEGIAKFIDWYRAYYNK